MTGPARLWFEDVPIDAIRVTPAMTVTQAHVTMYAGLTHDAAATGDAVPELLLLCLVPGLGWRIADPPLAVMAFMGFEWEVLHPVKVGDTVHSRSRTAAKRSMREGGVIVEERQVINQRGDVVHRGRFTFMVAKRPTT